MHGWQLTSVARKKTHLWMVMNAQMSLKGWILLSILTDVEARKGGI